MALSYPNKTIWFVKASRNGVKEENEGSAVAVRLQKLGKPQTAETYLLTCAHVVRGKSAAGFEGYGDVLPIRVWPPDVGFNEVEASEARIIDEMIGRLPTDRKNAADDWVVLKILKSQHASAAPTVRSWAAAESQDFRIYGYLGRQSLTNSMVIPKPMPERYPFLREVHGEIVLSGDGTRCGISGGGVFATSTGNFVGIHRARHDDIRQLYAVSAYHIKNRLYELGYEPAIPAPSALGEAFREFTEIWHTRPKGVNWGEAFALAKPSSSGFDFPAENMEDQEQALCAIEYLSELGPDQGVLPFFRFAHKLNETLVEDGPFKSRLTKWLEMNCSGEQLVRLQESLPMEAKGEPRIVIQMTRRSSDGAVEPAETGPTTAETAKNNLAATELTLAVPPSEIVAPALATSVQSAQRFHYTTWFLGFPKTPPPEECVGTRDTFTHVLEHAWLMVCELLDYREVLVELFVPKHLFSWAVERQQVRIGLFPVKLGTLHPFALRYDRKVAGQLLESRIAMAEKWSQDMTKPIRLACDLTIDTVPEDLDVAEDHFVVSVNCDIDPADLYLKLAGKNRVLGVLWESPPDTAGDEENDEPDAWDAAIESGVPLIMWLREIPPDANDQADLKKLFQHKAWESLPSEIQQMRYTAAQSKHKNDWHAGRHLAVILDHPRRPLPTASRAARLRSPGSRTS